MEITLWHRAEGGVVGWFFQAEDHRVKDRWSSKTSRDVFKFQFLTEAVPI